MYRNAFPPLLLAACALPSFRHAGGPPGCPSLTDHDAGAGSAPSFRHVFPAVADRLCAPEDAAHTAAFRLPAERDKRHLARLLLTVLLHRTLSFGLPAAPVLHWYPLPRLVEHLRAAKGFFSAHACPRLQRLPSGQPRLEGFGVSFSYSERAVFCLLSRPQDSPGVDAEALTSPAPPLSAFAARELPAGLAPAARQRDCLRRWTVKEAVFKAAATGCDRHPRLLDSGHSGQRGGCLTLDAVPYRWRLLPCPGHWLCVALRDRR